MNPYDSASFHQSVASFPRTANPDKKQEIKKKEDPWPSGGSPPSTMKK
jgi:hypothetical protein